MCGIAGLVSTSRKGAAQTDLVSRIVRAQVHRGPDHQATDVVGDGSVRVIFGHDRLRIIDLSAAANQPFWSANKRYCLTFNGEIYNYRELRDDLRQLGRTFRTASDTEVLVEAFAEWGVKAIERFNGMFAFAIADTELDKVWLVRDRFGVKPLNYTCPNSSEVWFASTAETISRVLTLTPDYGYLSDGLRWSVYEDGTERTQFEGLKSVEPGCYVEISAFNRGLVCEAKQYYNLRSRVERRQGELEGKSEGDLIAVTEALLRDAVRLRLRSDVPVGVSLSGGLDSSLLACLAAQEGAQVEGVSYGQPSRQDTEGPLVEVIARHLGLKVHYVWPSSNMMRGALWETLEAQESPFPGLNVVAQYLVYKTARAAGLKVMLGGQGADEAFMGYRKYLYMTLRRREHRGGVVADVFGLGKVMTLELLRFVENVSGLGRYTGKRPTVLNLPRTERDLSLGDSGPTRWRQLRDVTELSLPTLLRYEDRNSMGNSVESRLPYTDYRVVETGLALPDRLKVRGGYCKWVLRRIAARLLPAEVTKNRIKTGFDALQKEWFRQGLGSDIRQRLGDATLVGSEHSGLGLIERSFGDQMLRSNELTLSAALTAIWLRQQGEEPQTVGKRLVNA